MDSLKSKWNTGGDYQYYLHFFWLFAKKKKKYMERFSIHQVLMAEYQITNICWIMEKARDLHKYIYFCFIDYAKDFDSVNHTNYIIFLKR